MKKFLTFALAICVMLVLTLQTEAGFRLFGRWKERRQQRHHKHQPAQTIQHSQPKAAPKPVAPSVTPAKVNTSNQANCTNPGCLCDNCDCVDCVCDPQTQRGVPIPVESEVIQYLPPAVHYPAFSDYESQCSGGQCYGPPRSFGRWRR